MLQVLSGDNTGVIQVALHFFLSWSQSRCWIQNWIERVLKPNCQLLKEVYTGAGLPLPFAQYSKPPSLLRFTDPFFVQRPSAARAADQERALEPPQPPAH